MNPVAKPTPEMTLHLAVLPILFLVGLLACSVFLFGADSSYGANQVALVLTACVAALVGRRVGIPWTEAQLLCPLVAIFYGFTNFALKPLESHRDTVSGGVV